MSYFQLILKDIRKGENIELVITILIALIIAILQIFFPYLERYTPILTMAILAMLVTAMLVNRYQIEKLMSLKQASKSGIVNAYEEIPEHVLDDYYRKARREICILWTWTSKTDPLYSGLVDAAKNGVRIRILHLDPNSTVVPTRLKDLGFKPNSARPAVALEGLVRAIHAKGLSEKVSLRFYDAYPPFTIYRIDEKIILGFFWQGQGSSKGPHLEIESSSSCFGENVVDTFENIWSRATDVSLKMFL